MSPDAPAVDIGRIERAIASGRGGPEAWNPPFCGDIDLRIAADGTWFYLGTPIGRKALTRLFASVLRREADGRFYLVTPVEKVGIRVDDAPLLAVGMEAEGTGAVRRLVFHTLTGDVVAAGPDHPLRFVRDARDAPRPYLHVRGRLEALVARPVYYDLVALGEEREVEGLAMFGIASGGVFFPMAPAAELGGPA
jgi:uncharacterized protein